MGTKMGRIFKKENAQFPINLDSFQQEYGKKSGKLLEQYFPEAVEEIRGITDAIGYNNEFFTSWMMCMGCCLDIHEGNSVEVRGCTAFSFTHDHHVYYGRNNDLPPFLRKVSKSIYYQPENKLRFILNTSSFINGEEGVNQKGLVVAMTFVKPKIKEIKPGLNSVFLVRYILENCKSVDEGIQALKFLPISSSCNLLLADKTGKMAVVECNPFEINVRHPEKSDRGEDFIITVNHFTSEKMWKHDGSDRNEFNSQIRYNNAYSALKNLGDDEAITFIQSLLRGELGFMCQYKRSLNFATIWSSIFDISEKKVYLAEGDPRKAKFKMDMRLFN